MTRHGAANAATTTTPTAASTAGSGKRQHGHHAAIWRLGDGGDGDSICSDGSARRAMIHAKGGKERGRKRSRGGGGKERGKKRSHGGGETRGAAAATVEVILMILPQGRVRGPRVLEGCLAAPVLRLKKRGRMPRKRRKSGCSSGLLRRPQP
eukprot:14006106-Alexandrium_andersonii.AAC.1